MHKFEGPSCSLTFLGILIDTMATVGKNNWPMDTQELGSTNTHEKPERSFLLRMIDLSTTVRVLCHFIHVNLGFWSDLEW